KRLRSLEVDDELVFHRRLHRQVGGLLALEDAIDLAGSEAELLEEIGTIREETAGVGEKAGAVDRGQAMLGRQGSDQAAMDNSRRATEDDHAAVGTLCERRKGALDLAGIVHVDGAQPHAE